MRFPAGDWLSRLSAESRPLTLRAANRHVPVRRAGAGRIWVSLEDARHLPGFVDLVQEDTEVATGLLVSDGIDESGHRFRFKRLTRLSDTPPRDWVNEGPTGFLDKPRDLSPTAMAGSRRNPLAKPRVLR